MRKAYEILTEEVNDNADITIEYLKLILERLDEVIALLKKD